MFPCFLYVLKLLKMTCRDPPVHELLLIMDPRQPRRGIVPQQLLSGLDQGGGAWAQQAGPEHIRRKPIIFTQTLACACVCVFTITPGPEIKDWNQVPGTLSWGDSWVGLLGDQLIIQKKKSGQCSILIRWYIDSRSLGQGTPLPGDEATSACSVKPQKICFIRVAQYKKGL